MKNIKFMFNGLGYQVKDWVVYYDKEAIRKLSEIDLKKNEQKYLVVLDFYAMETGKAILIEIKNIVMASPPTFRDSLCKKKLISKDEEDLLRVRIAKARVAVEGSLANVNICGLFWVDDYFDYERLYQKFVTLHGMPYNFFIKLDNLELCGASPETLLKIRDGECRIEPLSGSIPNYDDKQKNKHAIQALLCNDKEINEHDAIVREVKLSLKPVCSTVTVEKQKQICTAAYSQHISSVVVGRTRNDINLMDILKNVYPPVAITGVPKNTAVKLINKIEGNTRDYYGGSIGFINGNKIDFGVIIRTFLRKGDRSLLQVGSKVSIGSDVDSEVDEILYKAQKVMDILQ